MTEQSEQTTPELVVPDLDLVVISSRHDERFLQMKVDSPNRTFVLLEPINDGSHTVIPTAGRRISDSVNGQREGEKGTR